MLALLAKLQRVLSRSRGETKYLVGTWLFFFAADGGLWLSQASMRYYWLPVPTSAHPRRMKSSNVLVGCLSETISTAAPEQGVYPAHKIIIATCVDV